MKKRFLISVFVLAAGLMLGLGACQAKHEDKSESYSYDFTENACPTGKKEFSSKEALCASLKDDAANGNCARSQRYDMFKSQCPGQSW